MCTKSAVVNQRIEGAYFKSFVVCVWLLSYDEKQDEDDDYEEEEEEEEDDDDDDEEEEEDDDDEEDYSGVYTAGDYTTQGQTDWVYAT
ncbi:MAG: hypothetical protein EZS28_055734 [Streblomastix strix]|uniref:Uncharacterized protein n=1 Tax=Streblomastix strix TaxID=222440 RepID=A0A5J4PV92_9EUKA|nr:MAG: hypothetical protein EZS28_055734 [Streblomastix strix]